MGHVHVLYTEIPLRGLRNVVGYWPVGCGASSQFILCTAEIVLAPDDAEVTVGNTVIFTCVALATPLLEVVWTASGETLDNESDPRVSVYSDTLEQGGVTFIVSTLEVCSVEPEDEGLYSCVARQGVRNMTAYFTLSVVELSKILLDTAM